MELMAAGVGGARSTTRGAVVAALLAFALGGCDEEASEGTVSGEAEELAGSDDSDAPSKGDDSDAPKWQVDYSGDLSGHIEGKSLVIVKTGPPKHVTYAVKTVGNNPGLTATLSVHEGEPSGFLTRVTLEDGTECSPKDRSDVKILDPDKETFHATIEGNLKCGEAEDRVLDFEAVIQEH
ncbi:MAG: hypothetical protein ACODAU_13115 [Myxococcota bacterium]